MKMIKKIIQFLFLFQSISSAVFASTRNIDIIRVGESNKDSVPLANKIGDLTDSELKNWYQADIYQDSIPGISLLRAYDFIRSRSGKPVIVAVIDGGIDINHEDLKDVIWTNPKEKPGNGIDDDGNGYPDDIHGWNFLGNAHESAYGFQLELTKMVKKFDARFENKNQTQISYADTPDYKVYRHLRAIFDSGALEASQQYDQMKQRYEEHPGDKDFLEYIKFLEEKNRYLYNLELDPRAVVGDNPEDLLNNHYGNNQVIGFPDLEKHGSHVAGIIAASRDNGKGINGIASNTKIMCIRATTVGDEYDKDIALAIHYAVDNGAKIINMSFGKDYSQHPEWVYDATSICGRSRRLNRTRCR